MPIALRAFLALVLFAAAALSAPPAPAQQSRADLVLNAIVKVHAQIPPDSRSARTLGTERLGTGVVIDDDGLVLTIGYLVTEAMGIDLVTAAGKGVQASLVAYDYDTGFALLRAAEPLGVKPLALGDGTALAEKEPVLVISHGGAEAVLPAYVVSRRQFAGYWEYLLDNAIFTAPPHPTWSGAALIGRDGKLHGIGSLIVGAAVAGRGEVPGNMFVPVDLLKPIMPELLAKGRSTAPPRPWLGISSEEIRGHVFITRVNPEGPAAAAGLKAGDMILGVGGEPVADLVQFYRKIWSRGAAGVEIPLDVLRGARSETVAVRSVDRYSLLRLNRSY